MTVAARRRRSEHSYIESWPAFLPMAPVEIAEADQAGADRFLEARFAGDPEALTLFRSMLFDPPRDVTDLYGRTKQR